MYIYICIWLKMITYFPLLFVFLASAKNPMRSNLIGVFKLNWTINHLFVKNKPS